MELINASFAKKIKPLVEEAMAAISALMENPDEFIFYGYWAIPHNFKFSENCNNIYVGLTVDEHRIFYAWIRNWLNASGWGFSHPGGCECNVENDFEGSQIFPLHNED